MYEDKCIVDIDEADNGGGANEDNDPNVSIVDMVGANGGDAGVYAAKTFRLRSDDCNSSRITSHIPLLIAMLAPVVRFTFQCS
ncbi:hypothetical protein INT45_002224 [Circinella minor]|uniref:Uncharacterized protein n=1 Tax=Circinella minor TaxID=1195481 RepID=A0A8H7SDT5_9FUNG|nr:hypothetical protein INT45_002224 [Circinella minor]